MGGATLMPTLLAFASTEQDRRAVAAAATALARILQLTVEWRPLPAGEDGGSVLHAVEAGPVAVAALPYAAGHVAHVVTDVIQHCPKPVLLVPIRRRAVVRAAIDRVLVPLDGTPACADAVAETAGVFCARGTDVVVLQVFDATTVPRFWDHPEHAREIWMEEFLARYCDYRPARMELRSGLAGESILDVAAAEHADLIALAWAQNLSAGRARTVRATLDAATIPVLLLPRPGAAELSEVTATHGKARS